MTDRSLAEIKCPRCGRLLGRMRGEVFEGFCKTPGCRRVVRIEFELKT